MKIRNFGELFDEKSAKEKARYESNKRGIAISVVYNPITDSYFVQQIIEDKTPVVMSHLGERLIARYNGGIIIL
jgi:hypothetical protein